MIFWVCASDLCLGSVQRSLPSPVMDLPRAGQMLRLQGIHKALPEARHQAQQLLLPIPLQGCFHNPSAQTNRSLCASALQIRERVIGIAWCPSCI